MIELINIFFIICIVTMQILAFCLFISSLTILILGTIDKLPDEFSVNLCCGGATILAYGSLLGFLVFSLITVMQIIYGLPVFKLY